jgi:hypothetical protein
MPVMNMEPSVENIILLAKQRHIDELQRLSFSSSFVEKIGLIIHQLQMERGASCLYLASSAKRFSKELYEITEQNRDLEASFKLALEKHLENTEAIGAKQLTLISWILLGFDEIKSLRHQVSLLKISFDGCINTYIRLISRLISLIFEITDSSVDTKISKYLVALYNLVQAKDFAGQERAVGAYLFGSGIMQLEQQQRLVSLVELQDRHFETFSQFATRESAQAWENIKESSLQKKHLEYRGRLMSAKINQRLDAEDCYDWFGLCSDRMSEMWDIQCGLVSAINKELHKLTQTAQSNYVQTESYLKHISHDGRSDSNRKHGAFLNLESPSENVYSFLSHENVVPYPMESIIKLLQEQSQQIAEIEIELSETKKALSERKIIERAKGLIMVKLGLNEEEAYKILRTSAMEQNRKIVEVAENIIELKLQST